jgi:hypothetical protein
MRWLGVVCVTPSSSALYFLRRCTLAKDSGRQKQFAQNPPTALGRVLRRRIASAAVRCILKNDASLYLFLRLWEEGVVP